MGTIVEDFNTDPTPRGWHKEGLGQGFLDWSASKLAIGGAFKRETNKASRYVKTIPMTSMIQDIEWEGDVTLEITEGGDDYPRVDFGLCNSNNIDSILSAFENRISFHLAYKRLGWVAWHAYIIDSAGNAYQSAPSVSEMFVNGGLPYTTNWYFKAKWVALTRLLTIDIYNAGHVYIESVSVAIPVGMAFEVDSVGVCNWENAGVPPYGHWQTGWWDNLAATYFPVVLQRYQVDDVTQLLYTAQKGNDPTVQIDPDNTYYAPTSPNWYLKAASSELALKDDYHYRLPFPNTLKFMFGHCAMMIKQVITESPVGILNMIPSFQGHATTTAGTVAREVRFYVWNATLSQWDRIGSGGINSITDQDWSETMASGFADYIDDVSGVAYFMVYTYDGSSSLGGIGDGLFGDFWSMTVGATGYDVAKNFDTSVDYGSTDHDSSINWE